MPNVTPRVTVESGKLVITALIDGIVELHVTPAGFYWVNGDYAKPGMHEPNNFPTFVNGKPWFPTWGKPNERRGTDKCELFAFASSSLDLEMELIAVGKTADCTGIEPRSPIQLRRDADELVVTIPDPEWGARWYSFALVPSAAK
jgi:hypothetical protein